jgi:hypothetical protein
MSNHVKTLLTVLTLFASVNAASAACYADYKAKRDNPLRLHYGVVELPDAACGNPDQATQEVADRLASEGWRLLNVLSVFDENGLDKRKESAGKFFLRF